MSKLHRRNFLKGTAALTGTILTGCQKGRDASDKKADDAAFHLQGNRKFLFVFSAMGGASINDSFLAVKRSETNKAKSLNVFPDELVFEEPESGLRAVDLSMDEIGPLPFEVQGAQSRFLSKYAADTMVVPHTGNSVAHLTAQYRTITGHDAWNGRTLQEAVAASWGQDLLLPNVNMSTGGFAMDGTDGSLPDFARTLRIADPLLFPFGLHGTLGLPGLPDNTLIELTRKFRNERLETIQSQYESMAKSKFGAQWLAKRAKLQEIEKANLPGKLIAFNDDDFPFSDYGIETHPQSAMFKELFPNLGTDPLQNQTLMAYLLVASGLSCSVTFGLGQNVTIEDGEEGNEKLGNTPTGFDYSHNAHRGTQALLWERTLTAIDRLITLLKATEFADGSSFYDHSLILIASEFGRDKDREDNHSEFPTGHHTNNAMAVISPLVNGGKVLGGIDKNTLLTYGFDPLTGRPELNREMEKKYLYAGLLQALEVDTHGSHLPDVPAMRKGTKV